MRKPPEKYSRQLDMGYTLIGDTLHFDDGVRYSTAEALLLARAKDPDIVGIHRVKKAFDGEIMGVEKSTLTKTEKRSLKPCFHGGRPWTK